MKAVVKVAYFDSTGLHRPGEIVDVKSPSRLVEVIKVTSSKKEEPKVEEPAPEPEPSAEEKLLTEIRDLLAKK